MEEQGKMNLPDEAQKENAENPSAQQSSQHTEGVAGMSSPSGRQDTGQPPYGYAQAPNAYGAVPRAPQYGYPAAPGVAYPQTPYQAGYPQYPQQAQPYRPQGAGAYPAQTAARPYGGFQQNAAGTGPGQYNYKASMQQHNQGSSYTGAGPGQYDFRVAAANASQKSQSSTVVPSQPAAAPQAGQPYGYGNYQQQYPAYPKPQGAGYGYYPQAQQQYGYPSQFGAVPPGQSFIQFNPQYGYGGNMYNQQRPNQPGGYPAAQGGHSGPPANLSKPGVPKAEKPVEEKPAEKPVKETPKPEQPEKKPEAAAVKEEVVEEIITENGKKKKIVRKVVKRMPSVREDIPTAKAAPRVVREQVKEIKERTGEEPIVVMKSKQGKKKVSKEGVYEPSLKDMIFGPPKKDNTNKDADLFEWKCPECGNVNADYVSTCKCGCTQRRAQNIAKGRIPKKDQKNKGNAPVKQQEAQPEIIKNEKQAIPEVSRDQLITPEDMFKFDQPNQTDETVNESTESTTEFIPAEPRPEEPKDEFDPEMPEKVELTEEEIQAQIDEFMQAPIQVWRPKTTSGSDKNAKTEIFVMGNREEEKEQADDKQSDEKKPEEKKSEDKKADGKPAEKSVVSDKREAKAPEKAEQKKPVPPVIKPVVATSAKKEEKPAAAVSEPDEFDGQVSDTEWKC